MPPTARLVTAREWAESVRALLELNRPEEALQTLNRAADEVPGPEFGELLPLLEAFPAQIRHSPEAVRLHLRLLGNAAPLDIVEEHVRYCWRAGWDEPFLHVFAAWVMAERGDDVAAEQHALQVSDPETLTAFERGLWRRSLGRVQCRLGRPGWQLAFEHVLQGASGRVRLLTLIEFAALLLRENDVVQAIAVLGEALSLRAAPEQRVRLHELLGLAYIRSGDFLEAERHFSELERLARRREWRGSLSRALSSLAVTRRALGEWERAEQLYLEALDAAITSGDEEDQRKALWGLGHTRRLSGRALGALEWLERGTRVVGVDRESGTSPLYLDIAAALVQLRHLDTSTIEAHLKRAGQTGQEGRDRAAIVRAEVKRRSGDEAGAREALEGLDPRCLWVREEALAFAELFALLPVGVRPAPLPRPGTTVVELHAYGFPSVMVNGRAVNVGPLALVVLTALLLEGSPLSTDRLTDILDDGKPRTPRQAQQRVSKAVAALRDALGWTGSIETGPGFYTLASSVQWRSDLARTLAADDEVTFLRGIDLRWVTDPEVRMSRMDADSLR